MNEKENPYTATCFWILAATLLLLGAAVYFLIPGYSFSGLVLAGFGLLRFLVLGIIAWAVALRLVQAGLQQIREEKCTRGLPR